MRGRSWGEDTVTANVAGLALLSFIVAAGFSAGNLLLPYLVLALEGILKALPEKLAMINASRAAIEVGGLVTAFMAARAFVAAASGWLSDKLGRKPLIVSGVMLYVASTALYYRASSIPVLLLLRGIQGVSSAMTWPVAETLLMDSVPPLARTRAMSIYVVSFNLGNVVGPLLGSATYAAALRLLGPGMSVAEAFQAPFLLLALLAAPAIPVALMLRDPGAGKEHHAASEAMRRFTGGLLELPAAVKRALKGFYANALLNGIAVGIVSSVLILYVIQYIARTPEAVGTLLAIPGFAGMLAAYPAARRLDRMSDEARLAVLVASATTSRLILASLGFIRSTLAFIAALTAMNVLFNILLPLMRSLEAGLVPSRLRGRVFGLHQAMFNIGMTVGPLIGSWIYEAYGGVEILPGITGAQAVFLLAGLLGLAGVPLIALLYRPAAIREAWEEG